MMLSRREICLLVLIVPVLTATATAKQIHHSSQRLPRHSTVFIDHIEGFGPELKKAFLKEGVPWVIVSNRNEADFEITGSIQDIADTESSRATINANIRDAEQNLDGQIPSNRLIMLSVVNVRTNSVVWGYGVTGAGDLADAAESCAKNLRNQIRHKRS